MKSDYFYEIALTQILNVGPQTVKTLLQHYETAEQVFKIKKQHLLKIPGIGIKIASNLKAEPDFKAVEKELKFIQKNNIEIVFYNHSHYPQRLKNCIDAPLLLYYKGTAALEKKKVIGIVGSRLATDYGRKIVKQLIEYMKPYDPLIISGLAYGIDITAHKESLTHGLETIGVLGHGLDIIYPATHQSIAKKMEQCGGLLTEFTSGNRPDRENFPSRNRIIAGLCDAIIVVEARESGGALITADIANSYNRDVFAFPGRINDLQSAGCNQLIKNNLAQIVLHPYEIIESLGWNQNSTNKNIQTQLLINLNKNEELILNLIQNGTTGVDSLMVESGLSTSTIANILFQLEINGLIQYLPGRVIKAI